MVTVLNVVGRNNPLDPVKDIFRLSGSIFGHRNDNICNIMYIFFQFSFKDPLVDPTSNQSLYGLFLFDLLDLNALYNN